MLSIASDHRVVEQENEGPAFASIPTTDQWPRSGDACPPPKAVRVQVDANKDGTTDHVATVLVSVEDVNNNGRFDAGIDRILLEPDRLERIDRRVRMFFGPMQWFDAVVKAKSEM